MFQNLLTSGRDSSLKIQCRKSSYCGVGFFLGDFLDFCDCRGIFVHFLDKWVSTFVGRMSRFSASEAKIVVHALLSFFWQESSHLYGVYIHSVWVFGFLNRSLVTSVNLEGEEQVSSSFCNVFGSPPGEFEVHGLTVPFINCGGDHVH